MDLFFADLGAEVVGVAARGGQHCAGVVVSMVASLVAGVASGVVAGMVASVAAGVLASIVAVVTAGLVSGVVGSTVLSDCMREPLGLCSRSIGSVFIAKLYEHARSQLMGAAVVATRRRTVLVVSVPVRWLVDGVQSS